jgi:type II secretory pathway pseudopilin PulG
MNKRHLNLFHSRERFSAAIPRVKKYRRRSGFSYAEVLVSATVLTTIMSLVTVSSFRISRVWKDIRQQNVALNELSNQLDRLTALPVKDVQELIDQLKPSDECDLALTQPNLSGVVETQSPFGHRLTGSITWQTKSGKTSQPLKLSAWWPKSTDREDSQQ